MNRWIRIVPFFIYIAGYGSDDVIPIGQGRCQRRWTIPERKIEYYSVREACRYYERCRTKTSIKTRVKIVDKPLHVDYCCEGYVNEGSSLVLLCEPTCEPMCVNGNCTAPGNCTCHEGYGKSAVSSHICEHRCLPECVNATCVGVNDCNCYDGFFKKDPGSPHTCSPKCTFGCVYGDCTGSETCSCHTGYTLSSNHSVCVPVCSLECSHGYCSAPDACTCDEGYVETTTWNVCSPYCSEPCINGLCTSPENCTCWDGYSKTSNSTCHPHCSNPCHNGACIGPEVCSCNEGYEKDDNDICIPICSQGCENGTCVSPDNCLCSDYHYFSNGTCLQWCAEGCTNGDCTGPNKCSCHPSTFRLSQSFCAQSCSETCVNYSSSIDDIENSTSLQLMVDSSEIPLCTQFAKYCCSVSIVRIPPHNHSWVVACSPKYDDLECEHQSQVPDSLQRLKVEITNVTLSTILTMKLGKNYQLDDTSCYVQLCPRPAPNFMSGLTRIKCAKDSDSDDLKFTRAGDHRIAVVSIAVLVSLLAFIIFAGIFYYNRKISYKVNDGPSGESSAQLYSEQQVEDEL